VVDIEEFESQKRLLDNSWKFLVNHSKVELTVDSNNSMVPTGKTLSDENIRKFYLAKGFANVFVTDCIDENDLPDMRGVFVRGESYSLN
jgi:hypothetical protein